VDVYARLGQDRGAQHGTAWHGAQLRREREPPKVDGSLLRGMLLLSLYGCRRRAHNSGESRPLEMAPLQPLQSPGSPNCAAHRVASRTQCACTAVLAQSCCRPAIGGRFTRGAQAVAALVTRRHGWARGVEGVPATGRQPCERFESMVVQLVHPLHAHFGWHPVRMRSKAQRANHDAHVPNNAYCAVLCGTAGASRCALASACAQLRRRLGHCACTPL
jgi:hypothetical protein